MKLTTLYFSFIFLPLLFISCTTVTEQKNSGIDTGMVLQSDTTSKADTVVLQETYNEVDLPENEYLRERLKPIRINFKRINSLNSWAAIDSTNPEETSEGGIARYYYSKTGLEKIVARRFHEMGQLLTEYYLLNGNLSFVFEKSYHYNRPVYYDSATAKENDDTTAFNFEDSEVLEDKSYFEKGKLLHQVNSQDCGAPFADEYLLQEQKRIQADYIQLQKLVTRKR